jgi:hypothetical protein
MTGIKVVHRKRYFSVGLNQYTDLKWPIFDKPKLTKRFV